MLQKRWRSFDMIFFDCDSTLSTIEGIDELAKSRGLFDEVQRLTSAAMDGEIHLESVYDKRLQLLQPTRREIRRIERLYRETLVPDAAETIAALISLGKSIFIVSGGLYAAVCPFGEWLGVPAAHIQAVKVKYDTLSGCWWDYQQDQWGEPLDVCYLNHDQGPLVTSQGKPDVVRSLKENRHGRSMLVGDGISDLAAQGEVDRLVGFGGVVSRAAVEAQANIFIRCNSLAPILPLATSAEERQELRQTSHASLLDKGLDFILQDEISFKNPVWRASLLEAAS